jgi:hypothetical protein
MNTSIYNPVAVGADVTASAHNLATAIDAKLAGTISASHTLGVIDLVSDKADGVAYPVTTSKPAVVSVGGATMGLGVAQTVSNATDLITKASHGFTVGLPVLYTGGTGTPSPLVTGTTYYALPATANTLYLSSTSALAQAGSYIGLSGIADGATAHTFTLTPLNITGVPGLKWKASNDGSAWVDLSVSSITMSAYTLGGTTTAWDFEWFNFRWLRMFVDGPTTGGIYIKSDVNVKK